RYCPWFRTDAPLRCSLFLYIAAMYYDFTTKSYNKTTKSSYIEAMCKDFIKIYSAVGSMYIYIRPMLFMITAFLLVGLPHISSQNAINCVASRLKAYTFKRATAKSR